MIEQAIQIIDTIQPNIKIDEKYNNNLKQLIKDQYPQIEQAIKKEKYKIEYQNFDNFSEIINDEKCIGFFTTETKTEDKINIILNECYIIPEHRGQKIIKDIIFSIKIYPDMDIIIRNPTREIIQTLEYAGLALPLKEGISYSSIKLIDKYENIIYTEEENLQKQGEYLTKLYDKNNSTMILLKDTKLSISNPRRNETLKYNLEPIEKINNEYTNNIKLLVYEYKHLIDTVEFLFYYKQLELLTVDNLIGTEDQLNDYIKYQLKQHDKTINEGFVIRDKIIDALNKNEITQLTINNRFMYLLEKNNKIYSEENNQLNTCPECNKIINPHFMYCHNCGYNLYKEDLIEELNKLLDDINPLDIYDEVTGLELKFQRQIQKEGYKADKIYQVQREIAVYQFLEFIDQNPHYNILPEFDLVHHIKPDSVKEFLLKNNLIEEKINDKYEKNFLDNYHLLDKIPDENHIDKYIYKIKSKGRRYYKKNNIAEIFTNNLYGLDYYQFKIYAENTKIKNPQLIINEYTDKKLRDAIRFEDCQSYTKIVHIDTIRLMGIDDKLFVTSIIKTIICSLNTYALKKDVTIDDEPIQLDIATLYIQFKELISNYNFNEIYNNAYETIQLNKLKINKQENKKIIKKLDKENIIETNKQITFNKIGII